MSRHGVLGTAGHVDHGKTSLIKVLSGVDCDTHKEEKRRGITINLGFTHIEKDNESLSVVDMPGHADFIKTMVAGASGLDLFLLVIDSESGIMPQTIEHLHILQTMGISRGVVAFTKSDLVEADFIELLQEELREYMKQFPFLAEVPLLSVSAKSGAGVEHLKSTLFRQLNEMQVRKRSSLFRLYIDRLFTIKGAGTVVAGSVLGGSYQEGDPLYLCPGNDELRVRRMERHGTEVSTATAGDRLSLNIQGVKKDTLYRGMQLASKQLVGTRLVDLALTFFMSIQINSGQMQVIFLIGSKEVQAHFYLIKEVMKNSQYLVQARFDEELFLQPGEPFVIRNSSDERSLGGGVVIDPAPLHHRKRSENLLGRMALLAAGDLTPKVIELLDYHRGPISLKKIATSINLPVDEFVASLKSLEASGVATLIIDDESYAFGKLELKRWRDCVVPKLKQYHEQNAIHPGVSIEIIERLLDIKSSPASKALLKRVIQELESNKKITKREELWFASGVTLNASSAKKNMKVIDDFVRQTKDKPPTVDVICKRYQKIPKSEINQIVKALIAKKRLFNIEDRIVHLSVITRYSKLFFEYVDKEGGGSRTGFRDYIGTGRRFASIIISYLEDNHYIASDTEQVYQVTEAGGEYCFKNDA